MSVILFLFMNESVLTLVTLVFIGLSTTNAQVGIGTTDPEESSALDVEATDKGFLPPRMTEAERDAISNPAEGLTIYNTDDNCLNIYVGYWRNQCEVHSTARTAPITFNGHNYDDVYNPATGETWLDRNLGASQVATSFNDNNAYGDLYQWGRDTDGHEDRTSGTYDGDNNGFPSNATASGNWDGKFITADNLPLDWHQNSPDNNLWQGVNGTNNPCPSGYRIPTEAEWEAERDSWDSEDRAGAYGSPLKLPAAGRRDDGFGSLNSGGTKGYYWSSTNSSGSTVGSTSRYVIFGDDFAITASAQFRAFGHSVRCIKD
jgi:uncharacterized protein (TIGR02145 family)